MANYKNKKVTNLLEKICKALDILESKDISKIKQSIFLFQEIQNSVIRQCKKYIKHENYELDFTSQDLRELAQDIHSLFKKWNTALCSEKNIKKLLKDMKDNQININPFYEQAIPIMTARTENTQALTELLSLVEYHAVFLYMVEEASNDKFALKYTERF